MKESSPRCAVIWMYVGCFRGNFSGLYSMLVLCEKNNVPNTALLLVLSQFHYQTENLFCQKYIVH